MGFNISYYKICKRTNHATKDCCSKSNFKHYQPWRRVQAHLVEEEMDDVKAVGDGYYQNGEKYDDILQTFIAESLSTTTPNASNVRDIWYLDTSATNHLTNRKDWLCNCKEVEPPL